MRDVITYIFNSAATYKAFIIAACTLPLLHICSCRLERALTKKFSAQQSMLVYKGMLYSGYILIGILVLRELGFSLTPLLGATGIAGIAFGFASQTSISNVISGIFLIAEHPFQVGDTISVGTTTGTVRSIDLLSVKLSTTDNRFVRIPNEMLLKNEVTTVTKFDTRKIELTIPTLPGAPFKKIQELLTTALNNNERILHEPTPPQVLVTDITAAGVLLSVQAWVRTEDLSELKSEIALLVADTLKEHNVSLCFSMPNFSR
jgi:small-conductance mechanosensitive channel